MGTEIFTGQLPPVRRVVTAENEEGKSYVLEDGPSPSTMTADGRPGYRSTNIWRTPNAPKIEELDTIAGQVGFPPPKGGTLIRVTDFPPEPKDPEEKRRRYAASFNTILPDGGHQPGHDKHPGMHRTKTIDYGIVIEGEIVSILEEEEIILRPGDVMIQRGTSHAWENRTDKMVRVAFVLIDAER
jgi:hypothetical protein